MLKFFKLITSVLALVFLIAMIYISPTLTTTLSFVVLSLLVLGVIALLSGHDDESDINTHPFDPTQSQCHLK